MKTAVVILNWNGADMMRRFLPSVVRHSGNGAEVIVADNGSTDNSCDVVEREFPTVSLLRLPKNYGFAEGYNKALEKIEAEYFLLLNSDVEVTPGWLLPLEAYLDAHPEAAACQPKLLSWQQKERFEYAGAAGGFLDRYGYPYCRGRVFGNVEADQGQYDNDCPIFWATGAALMVRSRDWKAAGGLDGRFFAHMEEIDFCWRLRARGRLVACVPQSVVYHLGGGTLPQGNPRKTFLNFRNNLLMLYKNLPERDLRPVMRVRRLLDYLAALQFALSGHVGEAMAVFRARRAFRQIRPSFEAARAANQAAAVMEDIPERSRESLLVAYYVKRKRTYAALAKPAAPLRKA